MKDISRDQLMRLLQMIIRNDTTFYQHHQVRRWDGATPSEVEHGATIWLTPSELARNALKVMGEPVPDPFAEMRAEGQLDTKGEDDG